MPCYPADDCSKMELERKNRYHARLLAVPGTLREESKSICERPYRTIQCHQVQLANSNERLAARRGLLMAVLCLLVCTDELGLEEGELFALLKMDARLEEAGGEGGGSKARDPEQEESFGDQGDAAGLLQRWQDVVKTDFVQARYLVREKRITGTDESTGKAQEQSVYSLGPAARIHLGALGALEVVRTIKGEPRSEVTLHSREKAQAAMPSEVMQFAQHFLKQSTFGVGDLAGDGEEEEEGEGGGAGGRRGEEEEEEEEE